MDDVSKRFADIHRSSYIQSCPHILHSCSFIDANNAEHYTALTFTSYQVQSPIAPGWGVVNVD